MSKAIIFNRGIVTVCETSFLCPICGCPHEEADWYPKMEKKNLPVIYIKCKGCKRKIGVSSNITGDVVVWEKATEYL